ncbi:MAG: bacteriohemerythrin [Desulfuromonadales bacterium]|nr:bacteriohemerythrin [Desulfuromonadales bacterium]
MSLFIWKPSYEIGINEIDMQHRQLVGMINELYEAIKEGHGAATADAILDRLIDYMRMHFSTEENSMQEHYYPGLLEHEAMHHELTRHVLDFLENKRTGGRVNTFELLDFLRDWLTDHISEQDKQFGRFLKKRWRPLPSDG